MLIYSFFFFNLISKEIEVVIVGSKPKPSMESAEPVNIVGPAIKNQTILYWFSFCSLRSLSGAQISLPSQRRLNFVQSFIIMGNFFH